MARISVGRMWDEAWAFLRAEAALLLPLALATIGAAMLLLTLVIPEPVDGRLPRGAWLFWLLPVYALMLTGVLAISARAKARNASLVLSEPLTPSPSRADQRVSRRSASS